MKLKTPPALEVVKLCYGVLDDKKAGDLVVLDVSEQSSITDYLVLATATSEPHLRALRVELEKVLDASRTRIVGMEIVQETGWMIIDLFDVMVHLFLAGPRERYGLERLWRDAKVVPAGKLLARPAPKPRAKAAPRAKGPAKRKKR